MAKEYFKLCIKWTFKWFEEAQLIMEVLVGLAIVAGIGGFGFALWSHTWTWLLGLVPFGILFVICAPFHVWREEHTKVLKYEKMELELIDENNDKYIQKRGDNWIFRIGVKILGTKSIDNVKVVIAKRSGGGHAFPDAPLNPAYSMSGGLGYFPINPDEIKFVEVCSWNTGSTEMRVHYHSNYQIFFEQYDDKTGMIPAKISPFMLPNGIPIGEAITLCATGNNVPSTNKTLRINVSGKQPLWEEVND